MAIYNFQFKNKLNAEERENIRIKLEHMEDVYEDDLQEDIRNHIHD